MERARLKEVKGTDRHLESNGFYIAAYNKAGSKVDSWAIVLRNQQWLRLFAQSTAVLDDDNVYINYNAFTHSGIICHI